MACNMQFQVHDVRFSDVVPTFSCASRESLCGEAFDEEIEAQRLVEEECRPEWRLTTSVFGRTRDGQSICVHVYGFEPELFYDETADLHEIRRISRVRTPLTHKVIRCFDAGDLRLDDEGVRMSRTYLRVAFPSISAYRRATYAEEGPRPHHTAPCLESKFFQATGLVPEGWAALDVSRARQQCQARATFCDLEYVVDSLAPLSYVECDAFAPYRCLAFDIESVSEKEEFPDATEPDDVVCQISLVVWTMGGKTEEESAVERFAVVLRGCDPIPNATVVPCSTESDLLRHTRDIILRTDPDVIVQYNGFGFDIPYLYERSRLLQCDGFAYLSRLRYHACKFEKKKMASSARGDQFLQYYSIPGRSNLDVMQWYMANYKKASYALNDVAFDVTKGRSSISRTS